MGFTGRMLDGAGRVRQSAESGRGCVTPEMKGFLLLSVIKMLAVFTVIMVGVALLTLMERKVSAWMQNRRGPNRVGPAGLLQPAADGLKNILKEETFPAMANRWIFLLAPAISFIPALLLFAVIPFGAPLPVDFDFTLGPLGRFVHHGPMPMVVADLPIGFLFVLAISSMGVYGIALAGWSSNSKYALLGGLRASAQMVSYEVAMGLSLIPVLLMSGSVSLSAIVRDQQMGLWYVLPLFLSFFIFLISGFAETNRLPFDMPEAESELIAGYHTEYSAMKFSFFFIAEYSNVVTVCAMVTTLFFGGWDIPFTHWDETGGVLQTVATIRVLLPQSDVLDLLRHVDPVDTATLPVRPVDGAGLEGPDAAGPGLHHVGLRGHLRHPAGLASPILSIKVWRSLPSAWLWQCWSSGCSIGGPSSGAPPGKDIL